MITRETSTRRAAKPQRKAQNPRLNEAKVWRPLLGDWRQLHGGFYDRGVSMEWHDFKLIHDFEWSRSFHEDSLELCLNLAGNGFVRCADSHLEFAPLTAGFYATGANGLQASRAGGEAHQFLALEFSRAFLQTHLSQCDGALNPLVEEFIQGDAKSARLGKLHRLTSAQEQSIRLMLQPPTVQAARGLWHQSQVLQLMVEFFFERQDTDELFCDRQKRLARERVDKIIAIIRQDLAEPPSLEDIGQKVGCSSFHLSRTFSREMGMTLPQYIRKLRMERAGELLTSGKFNVTEAAMEVGYSSLSHFSQAFCQTMGCCPALYPLNSPAQAADNK